MWVEVVVQHATLPIGFIYVQVLGLDMNYGNHKLDVKFSKVFSSKCFVLYGVGNLGKFNFKRNEKCDYWIFNYEKAYTIYFSESQVVNELVNMVIDSIGREE